MKAVHNIRNNNEYCFSSSILAALYSCNPSKNTNRPHSYKNPKSGAKIGSNQFPISLKNLTKFQSMNKPSINIFIVDKKVWHLLVSVKTSINHI